MSRSLKIAVAIAVVPALFTVWVAVEPADSQASVPVELVGTVVSKDTTGGAYILEYEGDECLFAIEEARLVGMTAYPAGASARDILTDLGRRRLLLLGKESGAKVLVGDDSPSKRFVLKGTLYVSNGTLVLESVKEAERETRK
jgi:hypothetical protein